MIALSAKFTKANLGVSQARSHYALLLYLDAGDVIVHVPIPKRNTGNKPILANISRSRLVIIANHAQLQ